jgi:enoyl-CoA hydratase/carnithine racemase
MSTPSDEGDVTIELRGNVLLIGLNRPRKRNAFDLAMYRKLGLAYARLDADPEARVGVLFAHGDHFTGGLDLVQWTAPFAAGKFPVDPEALDPLQLDGRRCSKPIVCALQGICYTIGIELMLATDVRVAATGTRFGQIEVRRGIYPVGGATIRMPREIGWANAMRWLLTADEFSAEEAHRIGLVQEVTPAGAQLERAIAIAETIAAQAPLGVMATLASARLAIDEGEAASAARLLPDLHPILASEDAKEGVQSFVERRTAKFTGR